jgi:hypothetical protein
MVNYQNGKIYAIRCLTTDARYIGCTTKDLLCKRLAEHVSAYKSFTRNKGCYCSSFDVLKHQNYIIELIEPFACSSRNELGLRELYHIKNAKCVNVQGTNRRKQCSPCTQSKAPYRKPVSAEQQKELDDYKELRNREYALLEQHTKEKHKFQAYYKITAELRNIAL